MIHSIIFSYIHTYIHTYLIYVYSLNSTYILYILMNKTVDTNVHKYAHTYIHAQIIVIHIYIHTYIHIHINIHTNIHSMHYRNEDRKCSLANLANKVRHGNAPRGGRIPEGRAAGGVHTDSYMHTYISLTHAYTHTCCRWCSARKRAWKPRCTPRRKRSLCLSSAILQTVKLHPYIHT